jgi:hypothetical protein
MSLFALLGFAVFVASSPASEVIPLASKRFSAEDVKEIPDFQRHVLPVMGKLGCNGRACHGSFQGAGGFRLSLFGYDFKADHEALTKGEKPRVNPEEPETSRLIAKPTLKMPHKGGERIKPGSWEHHLILRWLQGGAKPTTGEVHFKSLDVTPKEMVFKKPGEKTPLRVLAHWSDGSVEDVTCLCRFRSNDESIAKVDGEGVVQCVNKGDTHIVAFYDNGVAPIVAMLPVSDYIGDKYPAVATRTRIDQLIVTKLKKLGVTPSEICTDAEFLRRVSLDLTGTLPTPKEVEAFLADSSPDKRKKKIDQLLERPGYAAWWTTKLCDVTGQALNQLLEQSALYNRAMFKGWYDWLYTRVAGNVAYDKIVEGIVLAKGRDPGQSYESYAQQMGALARGEKVDEFCKRETMPFYWMRRNVQKPEEKSLNFAYAFLGVRLQCAECHKHPFDQWTQQDFQQFAAFFTPVQYAMTPEGQKVQREFNEKHGLNNKKLNQKEREEKVKAALAGKETVPIREVYIAKPKNGKLPAKGKGAKSPLAGRVITPKVLGGEEVVASKYDDPREPLMDWMRDEANPYFAKAFVNRVWANYFNVGIVDPPDDMNLANPPSNDELLDYLASGFAKSGFDMKWLHREICNSDAYQRSWRPNPTNELDTRNFSHAVVRRLPAEVVYDALVQCTANAEEAARIVSNPVGRAIGNLAPEGKGRRGQDQFALKIFGKPERATSCDCERMSDPTLVQSLYLRNDNDVRNLLDRKEGWVPTLAIATGQPTAAPAPAANAKPNRGGKGADAKAKPPQSLAEQITTLETRLRRAKARGVDKEKAQIPALEKQLTSLKQRQTDQAKALRAAGGIKKLEPESLIREAYLRTVCRPPTDEEMEIAKKYLAESRNSLTGLRDVVWALINTKEFITNH